MTGRSKVRALRLAAAAVMAASLIGGGARAEGEGIAAKKFDPPPEPKVRPTLTLEQIRAQSQLKNFEVLGRSALTWPGAGGQIALAGNLAYVALVAPAIGTDIIDVSDPAAPRRVGHFEPPGAPNVFSHKVRVCGDTLVTNAERNRVLQPDEWQGGLVIWNIANRLKPKLQHFFKVPGKGVHRVFFDCATSRVYFNGTADGFLETIEWVLDLKDPARPQLLSQLWLPGQKDGEPRAWTPGKMDQKHPYRLVRPHNVMPVGERLYAAWWDAGLTIWDVKDIRNPTLIARSTTKPPDQGAMHSALPIRGYPLVVTSDEWFTCPQGYLRIWNVRAETHPLQISTFQLPINRVCPEAGPRDLHSAHSLAEPATFDAQDWPVNLIFATWFAQGLRVVDIADPYRPEEVGYFVPPPWPASKEGLFNGHSIAYGSDVAVDWTRKLVYFTDRVDVGGGGLYILRWAGQQEPKAINFLPQ